MRQITLNEIIQEESRDPEFAKHFQREALINETAKLIVKLRQHAHLTLQKLK